MSFETILVGTDGSPNAERALEVTADLAAGGATVHVVCAYRPKADREIEEILASLPEEFHDTYDPVAGPRKNLERAERYLERRGIDHKSHLVSGHAASVILDLAESTDTDLIVVGSRGRGWPPAS